MFPTQDSSNPNGSRGLAAACRRDAPAPMPNSCSLWMSENSSSIGSSMILCVAQAMGLGFGLDQVQTTGKAALQWRSKALQRSNDGEPPAKTALRILIHPCHAHPQTHSMPGLTTAVSAEAAILAGARAHLAQSGGAARGPSEENRLAIGSLIAIVR